jgi:hypothetical protein
MASFDTVILEEPHDSRFRAMLTGGLSIDAYLEDQDLEYPAFSRRMAQLLRERHRAGIRLVQVEPFMDTLLAIHERFAEGQGPADLPATADWQRVYQAERSATAALIDFYRVAMDGGFDATIDAVKRFARADARRFDLRDRMRAAAVAALLPETGRTYIEAGPMHYPLWREIRRRLPADCPVRVHFLMVDVVRRLGYRRHLYGPGDLLTLCYRFHPDRACGSEDLLAARALIYNKLLIKDEIPAPAGDYPHTRDELEMGAVSDVLTWADCRRLYSQVKRASTSVSRDIVQHYLGPRWPNG